jgi:hypothetical protein
MKSIRLVLMAAGAMIPTTLAAQSLTGEWDATMETPGGARSFKVVFQVDGEKVTGTVKRPAGEVALIGTIKGDTLTFSYTIEYDGNALVLTVTALAGRDSLHGTVDFGGAGQADFSATRAPPPVRRPPLTNRQTPTGNAPQRNTGTP